MNRRILAMVIAGLVLATSAWAQAPIEYTLSFPAPEHRWMQVEARFPQVPSGTLQVRMARTSPGRYALHEFAKNVFEVSVTNGRGQPLTPARPNLHEWDVAGHDGTVVVTYKIYGDRTDGTYLGIDSMHAHINIPAALMFARGWFDRPARVTFVQPAGKNWKVASQLYPTADPLIFTAPNIHYLMDSPTDFSAFTMRTFTVDDGGQKPTFRIALTHDGTEAEADAFARDVERIVREAKEVFGEYPQYENNTFTFLSVYLPWANGDGMEHRNSTSLTGSGALRSPAQRQSILSTVSHEFFHCWNMERLRSRDIEPFDFEEADMSEDLWLGEGFTSYYDSLIMERAGVQTFDQLLGDLAGIINQTTLSPGRKIRSAVEMSRLAPFVDAAASIDRTAFGNTFISYYTYGSAIAFALDLTLRDKTDNRLSLDTYMQALWQNYGKPGQKAAPGIVGTPYTRDGLKATLANVAGDPDFAKTFFERYVEGRELVDYAKLLTRAGLVARKRAAGKPFLGQVQLQSGGSALRVANLVPVDSPLYKAGVEQDDQLAALDGTDLGSQAALDQALARRKPGDTIPIRYVRRGGEVVTTTVTLDEDPRVDVVAVEKTGGTLTPAQQQFRDDWLNSATRR